MGFLLIYLIASVIVTGIIEHDYKNVKQVFSNSIQYADYKVEKFDTFSREEYCQKFGSAELMNIDRKILNNDEEF